MSNKPPVEPGMTTRLRSIKTKLHQQSSSKTTNEENDSKTTNEKKDSNTQEWVVPKTKVEGRKFVVQRAEAYFDNYNNLKDHDNLKKTWDELKNRDEVYENDFPAFLIDNLKSSTVQWNKNLKTTNLKKAQFLDPFNLTDEVRWSKKSPARQKVDESDNPQSLPSSSTTYHEKLLQVCRNSHLKKPLLYDTTQSVIDGKTVWTTKVTHDEAHGRINGIGVASTKSASQELAAKHAIQSSADNPNPPITVIDPEEDDDELINKEIKTRKNTDDDDVDSEQYFSEQQRALIQLETKTTMQIHFQQMFNSAIDDMTNSFDKRIRTIVDETFDERFTQNFSTEIQTQVEQHSLITIQETVKQEVESNVTDIMKEKVQNAVYDSISRKAQSECKQIFQNQFVLKIKNHIHDAELNIQQKQLDAVDTIQDELTNSTNILKQLNIRDKSEINNKQKHFTTAMKNEFNGYLTQLETEVESHINNIAEVGDIVKTEITDHGTTISKTMPTTSSPTQIPSSTPLFGFNEEIMYNDGVTGQNCQAWIMEAHDDDIDDIFYTIKFANGNTMKASQNNLHKLSSNRSSHQRNKRFPNVNVNQIMSTAKQYAPQPIVNLSSTPKIHSMHQSMTPYSAPSAFDLKAFHQQFQFKLSTDADILTFYNQLKSQGKKYQIYLRDLNDIGPETDICPDGIDPKAREDMALAIYQKLQHENSRDFTYEHLDNCMEQHSDTSDGYLTLRELLRKVHPQLKVGKKSHDIPKLSDCNTNLFTLNKELKAYFRQQEIQGRKYRAKEKSEIYLQQLDDERYKIAKTKCLIDLNLATLHSPDNIAQNSLTFEALPATVQQIAEIDNDVPIIHVMAQRPKAYQRDYVPGKKKSKNYEPLQCKGCKQWGHNVSKCLTVPKIAIATNFIEKNPTQTKALIKEYLRVNDKNVKRSTVRALQQSGIIDNEIESLQYLNDTDIDIDTFSVEFDQPIDDN